MNMSRSKSTHIVCRVVNGVRVTDSYWCRLATARDQAEQLEIGRRYASPGSALARTSAILVVENVQNAPLAACPVVHTVERRDAPPMGRDVRFWRPGVAVEVFKMWAHGQPARWFGGYKFVRRCTEFPGTVIVTEVAGCFAGVEVRFSEGTVRLQEVKP